MNVARLRSIPITRAEAKALVDLYNRETRRPSGLRRRAGAGVYRRCDVRVAEPDRLRAVSTGLARLAEVWSMVINRSGDCAGTLFISRSGLSLHKTRAGASTVAPCVQEQSRCDSVCAPLSRSAPTHFETVPSVSGFSHFQNFGGVPLTRKKSEGRGTSATAQKTRAKSPGAAASGVGLLFAAPRPSYSTAEVVALLGDLWPEKYAIQRIRQAVREGLLHPFRRGTVNEFTLEEVARFICSDEFPLTAAELLNAALLTGFEFVYMPAALMLSVAGGWKPDPMLCWPPWSDASHNEPVTGTRPCSGFPAPIRDSHVARIDRRGADDRVPHARTRIRAGSTRRQQQPATQSTCGGGSVDHRPTTVVDETPFLNLNDTARDRADDDPAEISLDSIADAHEVSAPRTKPPVQNHTKRG